MTDIFDRASDLEQWQRDQAIAMATQHDESHITSLGCHDCGEEIPAARRQAAPHCTRCIDCQAAFEKKGRR